MGGGREIRKDERKRNREEEEKDELDLVGLFRVAFDGASWMS